MPERGSDAFTSVERADCRQHMGGISALRAAGAQQASVAKGIEERLEEEMVSLSLEEAGAKLAEDGGVEAGMVEGQSQKVSGSRGAFRLPSPLRTGRAPLNASGSSKPYAVRMSAPLTQGRCPEWICSWQTW